jgi:hypothetical protein
VGTGWWRHRAEQVSDPWRADPGELAGSLAGSVEHRNLELFRKYVIQASHTVKGERIFDPLTEQLADPDEKFMRELEKAMDPNAKPGFRQDILARIGAWALSHPNEDPAYDQIFPDNFALLREDYYKKQKETVGKSLVKLLELLAKEDGERPAEEVRLSPVEEDNARHELEVLLGEHDGETRRARHTRETLRETLVHLAKARY